MNFETVAHKVGKLGAMKYFPADVDARLGIAEELSEICHTEEQIDWLVTRTIKLYPGGWPGVGEMRAVYCSRFKPKDGIEAYSSDPAFLNGIPSETADAPLLSPATLAPLLGSAKAREFVLSAAAARPLAITGTVAGEPVTAAASINAHVRDLARMKDMNSARRIPPKDFPIVQVTAKNEITPADIDKAVRELRTRRAEAEVKA